MTNKTYLVIFDSYIGGQLVRTEVETDKDPLTSRQVRRDCEVIARASFTELAAKIGMIFDAPIKAVECVEFRPPEDEQGAENADMP